jgi:hypothetical protein
MMLLEGIIYTGKSQSGRLFSSADLGSSIQTSARPSNLYIIILLRNSHDRAQFVSCTALKGNAIIVPPRAESEANRV